MKLDTQAVLKQIDEFQLVLAVHEKTIRQYVVDKSFPLEERWNVFVKSGLGKIAAYIQHFDALNDFKGSVNNAVEEDLHDYQNRGTLIDLTELPDLLEEYEYIGKIFKVETSYDGNEFKEVVFTQEHLNQLKEEWLTKFIKGYHFDW